MSFSVSMFQNEIIFVSGNSDLFVLNKNKKGCSLQKLKTIMILIFGIRIQTFVILKLFVFSSFDIFKMKSAMQSVRLMVNEIL